MKPNPVGQPVKGLLDDQVKEIITLWEKDHPKPKWYHFWKRIKGLWFAAVRFIIAAGDYFVQTIDDLIEGGPEKKATVLEALGEVYDAIVPFLLPIFIRPFNKQLRTFVIDVVASLLIDFIVGKYREGSWDKEEPDTEPPPAPGAPVITETEPVSSPETP